ncbi:unnamed protein product [Arabis nemorensis]|uniref:Uncharacterized protein n=1 Tax=Arabis nemorensis TaxID=586526 RepID=A0A565CMV3_9BRAS|nr:unnamed protein product [Arabis nemorensis]
MPNMPIHPQFFNNNMPQQQQLHQFGLPNINHLLPTLLGNLQFAVANNNLMGHSLPLVQPNFFRPPLEPSAFTSRPQLNSFKPQSYPPAPNPHQTHQLQRPPGFAPPRPQLKGQSGGIVNNNNGSNSNGNDFRNKFTKHQKFKGTGQGFQRSQSHQANNAKKKFGFNKDRMGKGSYNKMASGLDGNIAKEKIRIRSYALLYTKKEIQQWRESRPTP